VGADYHDKHADEVQRNVDQVSISLVVEFVRGGVYRRHHAEVAEETELKLASPRGGKRVLVGGAFSLVHVELHHFHDLTHCQQPHEEEDPTLRAQHFELEFDAG